MISFKRFYEFVNWKAILKDDKIRIQPCTNQEACLMADEIIRLRTLVQRMHYASGLLHQELGQAIPEMQIEVRDL